MKDRLLLYFIKYPEPGRVKTRLGMSIGMKQAADIYKKLTEKNFRIFKKNRTQIDYAVVYDPPERLDKIQKWLSPCTHYLAQRGENLGERLQNAFNHSFELGYKHVVALGSDTLNLKWMDIKNAFYFLEGYDLILGPTKDGGYYLIGLSREYPELLDNIPWSTDQVMDKTVAAAKQARLSVFVLKELEDLDDVKNLKQGGKSL